MTEIRYKRNDNMFELTMNGHAGFAEAGKDVVCAGLTTLLLTLCTRLGDIADDWHVDLQKEYGHAYVRASGRPSMDALDTCLAGFKALAKEYPHFVSVEEVQNL